MHFKWNGAAFVALLQLACALLTLTNRVTFCWP